MKANPNSENMKLMKMYSILLIAVIIASCENTPRENLKTVAGEEVADEMILADMEISEADAASPFMSTSAKKSNITNVERKLIKNASVTFETGNIGKTREEITKLCHELNGFIATENHDNYQDRLRYEQVIRLPEKKFDAFIERLENSGYNLKNKNISTQDVTEEFIDVEARLKTKKDLELRYRDLLKFAKTVPEMISIEGQIENVRSDIESMEGRLNYLRNQVALSTITLSYYEMTAVDFGFASKFITSLKNGWDNLMFFVIAIMSIWPFIILSGVILYILIRRKKTSTVQIGA